MINRIPFLGWILSFTAAVGLAVPFWFFWTVCNIGEIYFYQLPKIYQSLPFWDCVGLFVVIAILKGTLIPKIFTISNKQEVKGK